MIVRAMKVNCGVTFTIQTTGTSNRKGAFMSSPSKVMNARTIASEKLVRKAIDTYAEEVIKVLDEHGLAKEGFLRSIRDARHSPGGAVVELEPWGFAFGTFENPEMGNSGSTPTDTRARKLLAYQAPLEKKELGEGRYEFVKDYTV